MNNIVKNTVKNNALNVSRLLKLILAALILPGFAHMAWAQEPTCFGVPATIVGTDGDDLLVGTADADVIVGLGGHDTILGLLGDDLLCGGEGNDNLDGGEGDDQLDGEGGDDFLAGGPGLDQLFGGPGNDLLAGEGGEDRLIADDGNDLLIGGGENDDLRGGYGRDNLLGQEGEDFMWGGPGEDILSGGPGNDVAGGGYDGDRIYGGDGDDRLAGGLGDDILNGGAGNDLLRGGPGTNRCIGGETVEDCETEAATLIQVDGLVLFQGGLPVEGADVQVSTLPGISDENLRAAQAPAVPLAVAMATTGPDGAFSVEVGPEILPVRVLAEILYESPSGPAVESARLDDALSARLDLGAIVIPNAQDSELIMSGDSAENAEGTIQVENLAPEVERVFANVFDPDETPEAFPGEFAENGAIPLNSSMFLWIEGLDGSGNPVDDLSQAATIRSRIAPAQWGDLEDVTPGTDRIEIPIYTYDEVEDVWQQQGTGWLEDGARTILTEDAQPLILDGTFEGDLFATFETGHFSWLNVDYPFIGPWRLSCLDSERRNNDCLFEALNLAATIALSPRGRTAYGRVNNAGADLAEELADGAGPVLKNEDLEGANAAYRGEGGGSKDLFLGNHLWDGCDDPDRRKDTVLGMISAVLHETAHWKDDVKKTGPDTAGEEGDQLEQDLFGAAGRRWSDGTFRIDGNAVDLETKCELLTEEYWQNLPPDPNVRKGAVSSPLEITVAFDEMAYGLDEPLPATVTLTNAGSEPIDIFGRFLLEDHPIRFEIVSATGERAPFLGEELQLLLSDGDFFELAPGASRTITFDLRFDEEGRPNRYRLNSSGTFSVTAVYSSNYSLPETPSNTVEVVLNPGGSVQGTVRDATSALPIAGAALRARQEGTLIEMASTDAQGLYSFPELPPGTYEMEVRASGFTTVRQDVEVVEGQTTMADFSLSPLLVEGELRLVLSWGAQPEDLDSHLWLPEETPFHLFFGRRGDLESCPNAELDVDDTSSFGPETVTISQLFEGTYLYAVHRFSGGGTLAGSGARVDVFDATGLLATLEVPLAGEGDWWSVLTLDGGTGAITELADIGDDPAPYADTAAGCATLSRKALRRFTKPQR